MIAPNNATPLPASMAAARLPDRATPGADTQDTDARSFETAYRQARGAPTQTVPPATDNSQPVRASDTGYAPADTGNGTDQAVLRRESSDRHSSARKPNHHGAERSSGSDGEPPVSNTDTQHNREQGSTAPPVNANTTADAAPSTNAKTASPAGALVTTGTIALAAAMVSVAAPPVPITTVIAAQGAAATPTTPITDTVSAQDGVASRPAQISTTVSAGTLATLPAPVTTIVPAQDASVHTAVIAAGLAPGGQTPGASVINNGNPMDPSSSLSAGPGVGIASLLTPGSEVISSPGTPGARPAAPSRAGSPVAGSTRSAGITTVTTDASSPPGTAATDAKLGGIERMFVVHENPTATQSTADSSQSSADAADVLANGDAGNASASQTNPPATAAIGLPQTAVLAGSAIVSQLESLGSGAVVSREPVKIPAAGGSESNSQGAASPSSAHATGAIASEQPPTGDWTGNSPDGGSAQYPRDDAKPAATVREAGSAAPFNGVAPNDLAASGTAASAEAVTSQTTDRAQLVQQISKHIESMRQTAGNSEMTVNLTHDHLGALRLTITTDEHGVAARIVVQTAQAHQAIEGAKEQLRSALENRGLNLTSLDVSLNQSGADGQNAFARQQERSQDAGNVGWSRPMGSAPEALPAAAAAAAAAAIGNRTAQGRLDYRA